MSIPHSRVAVLGLVFSSGPGEQVRALGAIQLGFADPPVLRARPSHGQYFGVASWLRIFEIVVAQLEFGLYCAIDITPSAMRELILETTSQLGSCPAETPFAP